MKEKENHKIENFTGKYEQTNFITHFIIENFFSKISKLLPEDAETILEVACGAGYSTQYLSGNLKGKIFEASDVNEELVGMAREKNPQILINVESIYALKRPDNSFDLILALEVLEHLENPEAALRELHRVSNKYVVLSAPNASLWRVLNVARGKYLRDFGNTPGHINHWSEKSFSNFISKYFKIIKVIKSFPWIIILGQK